MQGSTIKNGGIMKSRLSHLWLSDMNLYATKDQNYSSNRIYLTFNFYNGSYPGNNHEKTQEAYNLLEEKFNNNEKSPYYVTEVVVDRKNNYEFAIHKKDKSFFKLRTIDNEQRIPLATVIDIANHLYNTGKISVLLYVKNCLKDELSDYAGNRGNMNRFQQFGLSLFHTATRSHFSISHKFIASTILTDFSNQFSEVFWLTTQTIPKNMSQDEESKKIAELQTKRFSFLKAYFQSASFSDYLFKQFVTDQNADSISKFGDRKPYFKDAKTLSETLEEGNLGIIYSSYKSFIDNQIAGLPDWQEARLKEIARVIGEGSRQDNLFATLPFEIIHKIILLSTETDFVNNPDEIIAKSLKKP